VEKGSQEQELPERGVENKHDTYMGGGMGGG